MLPKAVVITLLMVATTSRIGGDTNISNNNSQLVIRGQL